MSETLHIAITGASGGLGRALAAHYAKNGATLSLSGRNEANLLKSSELCGIFKPEIRSSIFDVRDKVALENWIKEEDSFSPIDIIFANSGVCYGIGDLGLEDPDRCEEMFQVNTNSAVLTAIFAARLMVPRQKGQIVLISSQAGKIPLENTPGYSASKAALSSYGLSMRESLSRHGVKLSVVCPGYMHSHMMDNFEGFTPFAWSTQKAAAYIAEKLTKDPRIISFPFLLNAIIGIDTLLPNFITRPFKKKFSFRVKN